MMLTPANLMRWIGLGLAAAALASLGAAGAFAADRPAEPASSLRCLAAPARTSWAEAVDPDEPVVATVHQTRVAGRDVAYQARAGRIPIRDLATGEVRGRMFYMAYSLPPAPGAGPRPVTFLWGGGPLGPGSGVDTNYLGPKAWRDGRWADNPASLLAVSDLVFIDPVGTGFSLPARPEYAGEFFTLRGDAGSFAEFIRVWLDRYAAARTPVFLYGPSYGSWRAGVVSQMLEEKGLDVTGAMLISGGILVGQDVLSPQEKAAYRVPAQAATALAYGRLDPAFGRTTAEATANAERWVKDNYLPALHRIDQLTPAERETLAAELAAHTGYPLARIDRRTLAFSQVDYRKHMLADGREIDFLDMRGTKMMLSTPDEQARQVRYIREELGYCSDLAYAGDEAGYTPVTAPAYRPPGADWKYDIQSTGGAVAVDPLDAGVGPVVKGEPWMANAIRINPDLKVLVADGLFDSMNSCSGNAAQLERIDPKVAANFTLVCLENGHRMGLSADNMSRLGAHLRQFIDGAAKAR